MGILERLFGKVNQQEAHIRLNDTRNSADSFLDTIKHIGDEQEVEAKTYMENLTKRVEEERIKKEKEKAQEVTNAKIKIQSLYNAPIVLDAAREFAKAVNYNHITYREISFPTESELWVTPDKSPVKKRRVDGYTDGLNRKIDFFSINISSLWTGLDQWQQAWVEVEGQPDGTIAIGSTSIASDQAQNTQVVDKAFENACRNPKFINAEPVDSSWSGAEG